MFNSLYGFKQLKRNFQDSNPQYVPSLKKIRMWDESMENKTQQNQFDVDPRDMSFIRDDTSNLLINKPEYFPEVFGGINNTIETEMLDPTKLKYMPDLNATQNPHYYEYNKLLFELYLERTRRCKPHNPPSSQSSF